MLDFAFAPPCALQDLLTSGGDERLARDAAGRNRYGCHGAPQAGVLAFGSSTASTISENGFRAAAQLHRTLEDASDAESYFRCEREAVGELAALCGLDALPGLSLSLHASGTDAHRVVADAMRARHGALSIVMPQESETGSFVAAALGGTAAAVPCRLADGNPRPAAQIDLEVEWLAAHALSAGRHVLIVIADVSKTGLIAPGPACALALKRLHPDKVDVLIDACQFRLSNRNLRAYLEAGCMVALTGSKFVTGPAFSGALLLPDAFAAPPLATPNWGLLLRWRAALAELFAFRALPEDRIAAFAADFARAIRHALATHPTFEPVHAPPLRRAWPGWDETPTIFPFLLRQSRSRGFLAPPQVARVHRGLIERHVQLGQPVACGHDHSALRLSLDARLIADAIAGRGARAVIDDALAALNKAAELAAAVSRPA
jgi:hypothetical protein